MIFVMLVNSVKRFGAKRQNQMKQVVAAIIVRDSKILICQRTEDQAMPLKWEFPGGKVERDEDLKDALHRELDEELGIDAVIGRKVAGHPAHLRQRRIAGTLFLSR